MNRILNILSIFDKILKIYLSIYLSKSVHIYISIWTDFSRFSVSLIKFPKSIYLWTNSQNSISDKILFLSSSFFLKDTFFLSYLEYAYICLHK